MSRILRLITIIVVSALVSITSMTKSVAATDLKILIPLYSYPTWYNPSIYLWDDVANAVQQVPITAVINPNSGPGGGPPNSDYVQGLNDLRTKGVTLLGYVATNYGDRSITDVKADVDLYAIHYNLNGIFFDEAASSADKILYYQELYNYVKSNPNLKSVVLNPGTNTDESYLTQASDIAIIFENYSGAWPEYKPQPFMSKYQANHFSTLIHSVPDARTMKNHIACAANRNIGYVYVTNDGPSSPDRNPWNSLPPYWQQEVTYIRSLNQGVQQPSRCR